MRAMVVRRYGPPEVFEARQVPDPQPKPGEVLIRVKAIGVNFADLLQRMGLYPDTPKPPFVPGLEIAGVVEKVIEGARRGEGGAGGGAGEAGGEGLALAAKIPVWSADPGDRVERITPIARRSRCLIGVPCREGEALITAVPGQDRSVFSTPNPSGYPRTRPEPDDNSDGDDRNDAGSDNAEDEDAVTPPGMWNRSHSPIVRHSASLCNSYDV